MFQIIFLSVLQISIMIITPYPNETDFKKGIQVINEITGKTKLPNSTFPRMVLKINIETFNNTAFSNNLNKYYTEIGTNLANKNR